MREEHSYLRKMPLTRGKIAYANTWSAFVINVTGDNLDELIERGRLSCLTALHGMQSYITFLVIPSLHRLVSLVL